MQQQSCTTIPYKWMNDKKCKYPIKKMAQTLVWDINSAPITLNSSYVECVGSWYKCLLLLIRYHLPPGITWESTTQKKFLKWSNPLG